MKIVSIMRILIGLVGLAALSGPPAWAQAEIDPDHFDSPNVEAFEKANSKASIQATTIRYDGRFTLPYSAECERKSLRPGKYSVSLRSNGKVAEATLIQKGQAMGIHGVIHKQIRKHGNNAVLMESDGRIRKLAAIQLSELDLVFYPESRTEHSSDNQSRRVERLPLIETHSESVEHRTDPSVPNRRP